MFRISLIPATVHSKKKCRKRLILAIFCASTSSNCTFLSFFQSPLYYCDLKVQIVLFALLSPPKPHLKESEFKPLRGEKKSFLVGFGHLTSYASYFSEQHNYLIRFPQGNNFTEETLAFCSTYYDQFPRGLISCFSTIYTPHTHRGLLVCSEKII